MNIIFNKPVSSFDTNSVINMSSIDHLINMQDIKLRYRAVCNRIREVNPQCNAYMDSLFQRKGWNHDYFMNLSRERDALYKEKEDLELIYGKLIE